MAKKYRAPRRKRVPVTMRMVKVESMLPWWAVDHIQRYAARKGLNVSTVVRQIVVTSDLCSGCNPEVAGTLTNPLLAGTDEAELNKLIDRPVTCRAKGCGS